jgi:hypothetical protein
MMVKLMTKEFRLGAHAYVEGDKAIQTSTTAKSVTSS